MPTTNVPVDLGGEAASSLEFLADVIERELNRLDALEQAADPGAARDDPDFQRWCHQIRGALVALRGLGLLLSDSQAIACRHLWWAAYEFITPIQEECSSDWTRALQELDGLLPRSEKTE